ncbi:hypothetical protein EDC04DRAFT_2967343 [Pisolithus marmoratus]|nr:hypothetical protein EDC04DRAFT_2967343 [Pisolithus marmoratus]
MPIWPHPVHAQLSMLMVQHFLTTDCHRHCGAINVWEPQHHISKYDFSAVSPKLPKLSSTVTADATPQKPGENGALSVYVSPLVDQGQSYWCMLHHVPNYVANDNTTISAPHTTNYAELQTIGQLSRCQQENCNFSTFNHQSHGTAGLMMGPGSFDDHTSGQVVGPLAAGSELPSLLLHECQDMHPSGGLTSNSVQLLPDQIQTGVAAPAGFYGGVTSQPTQQTHLPATYSDTLQTPPQPNTNFYSTPNNYTLHHPSMQIPNKIPASQFLQEFLRHPFPLQSLQGPQEIHAGSEMGFHTRGTVDNHTAHMLSNCQLSTSSDHHMMFYPTPTSQFLQEYLKPPFPIQSLQGPQGIPAGSEMGFHTAGTINNHAAHMLSNC